LNLAKAAIRGSDYLLSSVGLAFREDPGIVALVFHGLFHDRETAESGQFDPQQGVTVEDFKRIIAKFLENEYRFVGTEDILSGLAPQGKYALVTFDDGYYNNFRALPVLREFRVPAVFFVSVEHILQGKAFWWDVVFREMKTRGKSLNQISMAVESYKCLPTHEIEARLKNEFGIKSLEPSSDEDRPMTPSELKALASEEYVVLGNHTMNHAILTNYPDDQVREQIERAQSGIFDITGVIPNAIAYPNGRWSPSVLEQAVQAGLRLGFTVMPGKNKPISDHERNKAMLLKRCMPYGGRSIEGQCALFRSSFSIQEMLLGTFRSINPAY